MQAWTHTHLSIWFGHEKKSEIETHPPKAARLWYRVGRKTTFFLFCFKGKRAFESSSVRATTKRPFLLVLLPKERPLPPPTNGNSRHDCRSRCEVSVAPPSARLAVAAKLRERAAFPYTFDCGRSGILKSFPTQRRARHTRVFLERE